MDSSCWCKSIKTANRGVPVKLFPPKLNFCVPKHVQQSPPVPPACPLQKLKATTVAPRITEERVDSVELLRVALQQSRSPSSSAPCLSSSSQHHKRLVSVFSAEALPRGGGGLIKNSNNSYFASAHRPRKQTNHINQAKYMNFSLLI